MLAPGHNGFKSENLLELLQIMIKDNLARGIILILDTLKKFTDPMDKHTASAFGRIIRQFISKGGSVITLAHTNKHRDLHGKLVYQGTSDIVDDADCVYTIDTSESSPNVYTALFENIKNRGDVARTVGYQFEVIKGQRYEDLLNSVMLVDETSMELARQEQEINLILEKNADIIETIVDLIESGTTKKLT